MPKDLMNDVWEHWPETGNMAQNGKPRVVCMYCGGHEQLKNAPKCKKHTAKCPDAPSAVRKKFTKELYEKEKGFSRRIDLLETSLNEIDSEVNESNDKFDQQMGDEHALCLPPIPDTSYVSVKTYSSSKRKKVSNNGNSSVDDIVQYIDTFHRIKDDMNFMLTQTSAHKRREFLSFAMEVMSQYMTDEDRTYLDDAIKGICNH